MSEVEQDDFVEDPIEEVSELQAVKEIAANMGIKVGNTKDVDKIKAMIAERTAEVETPASTVATGVNAKSAKRAEVRERLTALKRVRIIPLSPYYRQLKAVTAEFSNKFVGEIHRVIPFEVDWHVEQCILDQLKSKVYRSKVETKDPVTGRPRYHNEFRPSFGIYEVDKLTKAELEKLARDQAARNAID